MYVWSGWSVGGRVWGVGVGVSPLYLPGRKIPAAPLGKSEGWLQDDSSCLSASLTSLSPSLPLGHSPAQTPTSMTPCRLCVRVPPAFKASDGSLSALSSACGLGPAGEHPLAPPLRPSKPGRLSPLSPPGLPRLRCHPGSHSLVCNSELQTL